MKHTTYLNNQKMVEWGLNFSQGAVLDWLTLVPSWAEQMIEGKDVWYFASRTVCLKELPTVGTSEDTIYRIYKALEKLGLIEYKKVGAKDYIKLSKKAKEWHYKQLGNLSERSEIYPNNLGNLSETNSDENPTYKIINLDHNTIDQREGAPKKNDSVKTENQTEEIIPPGAAELQTFAGLKKAMRNLEDTPANRIQALKFYEIHILGDYFMSSWEYLSDGMPISPQRVIKEWIMKGGWYQITECQYNKIGNWIKTEFKILNEKNEKSGKQPIITMDELYDIDARLAADGY